MLYITYFFIPGNEHTTFLSALEFVSSSHSFLVCAGEALASNYRIIILQTKLDYKDKNENPFERMEANLILKRIYNFPPLLTGI